MMYDFSPFGLFVMAASLILSGAAQMKVRSAYSKWSQVGVRSGVTGAQVAQRMMRVEGINNVGLETTPGEMTDHYDPRAKTVRLSDHVYHGHSIASLGIAAHEIGHVIQDSNNYAPMRLRSFVYPVAAIGSNLGWILAIIGIVIMGAQGSGIGLMLAYAGIYLFAGAVAFTLITLPVEFDASRRAMRALASGGVMTEDELAGARSVLTAAALTYVAAAAVAILQLVQLLLLVNSNRE